MKNNKEIMIYPFDINSIPLVRHNKLNENFKFTKLISPSGWGLDGKDASCADGGSYVGLAIESNFDEALKNCDTVFFNEPDSKPDIKKLVYPKIIKAAEDYKNIICSIELNDEMRELVSSICKKNNIFFKYFRKNCEDISVPSDEMMYKIYTPIILVAGTYERTNKFELQLELRTIMKNMGYRVSQIGSRHYCELLGFNSFPAFMYSGSITEDKKVILFNHYIKNIEINENPDVIIIGLPGGTSPITNILNNKFGILAYEVSQAVTPDAVVLSLLYNQYKPDFTKKMSEVYKYKFGYSIDCFNISNSFLNISNSENQGVNEFITTDCKFINDKKQVYSTTDFPVYNILDSNDSKSMVDFLINRLSGYAQNETM